MIGALRTLGVTVDGDDTELTVSGRIAPAAGATVDCGLAGTVLRFVPPVAALSTESVVFDGDEQARARPIAPLLDALRGLGVDIDGDGLPFAVRGTGSVAGGTVEIDASASSQFVSGLLLSGAAFTDGLTIVHTGESVPSAPHVAMTVAMLREAGVDVDDTQANRWRVVPRPDRRAALGDRARPVQRGAVPRRRGGHRRDRAHRGLAGGQHAARRRHPRHPREAGRRLCGTAVRISRCRARSLGGFDVDLHDVGELAPAVAALAALAAPGSVSQLTRHRPPARPRDRPARRADRRDQRPRRALRGDTRRTASSPRGRCTAGCGGPTPTTGWRPRVRSSGCGCPASRSTTSPPRRRHCRTSRGCGPTCWQARRRCQGHEPAGS